MTTLLLRSTSACSALLLLGTAAEAQGFSVTPLGTGIAESITPDGTTVVGGNNGAWTWTQSTGQVLIGGTWANGVSADGSIVFGNGGFSPTTAATWTSGGGWQSIGGLPGSTGCPDLSNPYAISDGGDVATGLGWDGCSAFAFRWHPVDGFEQLPQDGPFSSRGNTVSGDGTHIGGWDEATNGTRRAAIWFPDGSEEIILEDPVVNPVGAGEVWGFSTDGSIACGSGANAAFRWTEAGGPESLGSIPGFQGATAMAISDDGKTAVGFAGIAFFGITGFIWTEADGIQRFSDYAASLGFTLPAGQDFQYLPDITPDGRFVVGYVAADAGPFSAKTAVLIELPQDCGTSTYGVGASPANYLDLTGSGDTDVGGTFLATTSGSVGTLTVTIISLGSANFPFLDGVALFDPLQLVLPLLAETPVGGVSTNSIPIPPNPALAGLDVFFQTLSDDGGLPFGWGLSNGLQLTICP